MTRKTQHIVMFSTGISSAYLSKLLLDQYGHDDVTLFMTDTLWEDEDNYRFMLEVSEYLKKPITVVADGRTPEQVFFNKRFFGNFGTAPCSSELKMRQTVIYVEELRSNGIEPILYFGIGGGEEERAPRIAYNYSHNCLEPVECRFPLMNLPVNNTIMTAEIEQQWGVKVPRMYRYGFGHANCGGRCVKGGIQHYRQLYLAWPSRFRQQEDMEQRFRDQINDYTILKKFVKTERQPDGSNKNIYRPYPLSELRQDIEQQGIQEDIFIAADQDIPCVCIF